MMELAMKIHTLLAFHLVRAEEYGEQANCYG